MQEMTIWEYKTEYGDYGEDQLNEWGNDGWELVTVISGEASKYSYFFKRHKQPKRH